MERILTNNQVEWLVNVKLLSEYEDDCFSRDDMPEKLGSFIENEFPGKEDCIVPELEVLKEKGFLVLGAEFNGICFIVSNVDITKKGLDYLTMLEEDFAEKLAINSGIVKTLPQQTSSKDILDYIEQISTIISNLIGLVPHIGNFSQGAIPFAKKAIELLVKSS